MASCSSIASCYSFLIAQLLFAESVLGAHTTKYVMWQVSSTSKARRAMTTCWKWVIKLRVLISGTASCWANFSAYSTSKPKWFILACGTVPGKTQYQQMTAPYRRTADKMKNCCRHTSVCKRRQGWACRPYSSRFCIPEVDVAPVAYAHPAQGQQTGNPRRLARL